LIWFAEKAGFSKGIALEKPGNCPARHSRNRKWQMAKATHYANAQEICAGCGNL
jgi:hypothetical protein